MQITIKKITKTELVAKLEIEEVDLRVNIDFNDQNMESKLDDYILEHYPKHISNDHGHFEFEDNKYHTIATYIIPSNAVIELKNLVSETYELIKKTDDKEEIIEFSNTLKTILECKPHVELQYLIYNIKFEGILIF